jgi:hypothetical protein
MEERICDWTYFGSLLGRPTRLDSTFKKEITDLWPSVGLVTVSLVPVSLVPVRSYETEGQSPSV